MTQINYFSVFSGIEAATVAFEPMGWVPVGFAEIDPFACAVLAHRFGSNLPGEPLSRNAPPNYGDVTELDLSLIPRCDVLVGGSPCQAFSFAGKRESLADARGNLTLAYAVLAHGLARSHGLRNALWENVPGVLSTPDNAFGCFLGALIGADTPIDLPARTKRWPDAGMVSGPKARAAWRVLDAQYFDLAQRRKRVFVVVDFGNGADPAEVLFEPKGMFGDSPPSRETGESVAPTLAARTRGGGGLGTDFDCDGGLIAEPFAFKASHFTRGKDGAPSVIAPPLSADADRGDQDTLVFAIQAGALRENPMSGPDGMGVQSNHAYTLEARAEVQAIAYPIDMRQASRGEKLTNNRPEGSSGGAPGTGIGNDGDPSPTIAGSHVPAVVFQPRFARNDRGAPDIIAAALTGQAGMTGKGDSAQCVAYNIDGWVVRRLTTVECARLQGFEDNHTQIPWRGKPADECPDGPQYKTFGNSMATKVMKWIGHRLDRGLSVSRPNGNTP